MGGGFGRRSLGDYAAECVNPIAFRLERMGATPKARNVLEASSGRPCLSDLPDEMHVAFVDADARPTGLGEIGCHSSPALFRTRSSD
jgi:hypothetical protein